MRNEGDGERKFIPNHIPTKLPNLVYIEGPNSIGKSTLLNLIALGFHGLKEGKINEQLKPKMENLLNMDHNKLTFKITITANDDKLELRSEKNEMGVQEINVYERVNGEENILTPESFKRKYNLIYDIPDDPTTRLSQLASEIKDIQQSYGVRIKALKAHLLTTIEEIKRSRDPEVLNNIEQELQKNIQKKEKMKDVLHQQENELEILETYYFCKGYSNSISHLIALETRKKDLEKSVKKKKSQIKKVNKEIEDLRSSLNASIEEMQQYFDELTNLLRNLTPKKEKYHLEEWERIHLDESEQDLEFSANLKTCLEIFNRLLQDLKNKNPSDVNKAQLFKKLIELLQPYRNTDIALPGLNKSVDGFLNDLEYSSKEYEQLLVQTQNIDRSIELLNNLDNKIRVVEIYYFPKLKEYKLQAPDDFNGNFEDEYIQQQIDELTVEIEKVRKQISRYIIECGKKNIIEDQIERKLEDIQEKNQEFLRLYRSYTDNQLDSKITDLNNDVRLKRNEIEQIDRVIQDRNREKERMEKMEPHKLQDRLKDIQEMFSHCKELEQKFLRDYNGFIKGITNFQGNTNRNAKHQKPVNHDQEVYFNAVAEYLGRKVKYIRHIDREYKVKTIDLLNETIKTEDGKVIRFVEMGTGQSQSAYLTGLLNVTDKRKIIALFDEVAMMDQQSLDPIFKKFRELYKQNRMILGIVIQKADKVKINSLE